MYAYIYIKISNICMYIYTCSFDTCAVFIYFLLGNETNKTFKDLIITLEMLNIFTKIKL